jgi:hypothetical protein
MFFANLANNAYVANATLSEAGYFGTLSYQI